MYLWFLLPNLAGNGGLGGLKSKYFQNCTDEWKFTFFRVRYGILQKNSTKIVVKILQTASQQMESPKCFSEFWHITEHFWISDGVEILILILMGCERGMVIFQYNFDPNAHQIFVRYAHILLRISCKRLKQSRWPDGHTGNVSPRSLQHPQQNHLVFTVPLQMTQSPLPFMGILISLSWCLDPGFTGMLFNSKNVLSV